MVLSSIDLSDYLALLQVHADIQFCYITFISLQALKNDYHRKTIAIDIAMHVSTSLHAMFDSFFMGVL